MTDQSNKMAQPLRTTPLAFRCWLIGCVLALLAGLAALELWAPGPNLATIVRQPGAIVLFALMLLADLYPTLPWMRNSNPFDEFILSTPLAIAALLVYGPHAAVVFIAAGAAVTMALHMVWWRVLLNATLCGLQGIAAAGVLALITGSFSWTEPMPSIVMLPITAVLAVVIEASNVVLIMISLSLIGASSGRSYLNDWRSQVAIGALALTAPIPAVLAAQQPALLPLLALAMVAAQSGMSAVSSRTALAGTDPLTSVATRTTLLDRLKGQLGQLRPGDSVNLLLVDLDRFKEINDDYGHLAGDRVLVEVARRLEESTRSADLVARFGGDEFAILLSGGASSRSVDEVAARVKGAVGRPIQVQGSTVSVGVSIGSAIATQRGVDALGLIELADAALYRAKAARPIRRRAAVPAQPADPQAHDGHARPAPIDAAFPAGPTAQLTADRQLMGADWQEPAWSRTQPERAWQASMGRHPAAGRPRSIR